MYIVNMKRSFIPLFKTRNDNDVMLHKTLAARAQTRRSIHTLRLKD